VRKLGLLVAVTALVFPGVALANDTMDAYGLSSSKTFYPFVHDGYRDVYRMAIDFFPPPDATDCDIFTYTVEVLNANSVAVRTMTGAADPDGLPTKTATWDGRKDDGTLVAAGGYYTISVTDDGTCYDVSATPVPYQESDSIANVHPVKGFKLVLHKKRTAGYVGAKYASGPCPQRRWDLTWQVDCKTQASAGIATFHHKFPRNAVVGTRRLASWRGYMWWLPGWYKPPKSRNDRMVGRTYYIDLKVFPHTKARVQHLTWAWKVKVRI
jgi:hypothetical protein